MLKKSIAHIAIRLTIIISIIFILLSQGFASGEVIFFGSLVTILCMAMVFFSFDRNDESKSRLIIDIIIYIIFVLILFFNNTSFIFLAAILYPLDISKNKNQIILSLTFFFVYGLILNIDIFFIIGTILITILFIIFNTLIISYNTLKEDSYKQIDNLRHLNNKIKEEQNKLILLQDSAIRETRDAERKRITSEIHDNLGHDLSASIIQLAALEYQIEDEEVKSQIKTIRELLSSGMEGVRSAIHNEHNDSIDLKTEFEKQCQAFTKADIKLYFSSTTDPKLQVKHSLINILKEALTNINKHSNAKKVKISFTETKDDWILLIADDGSIIDEANKSGLGLINMEERVHSFGGSINIYTENGFRIFIRMVKEGNI